MTDLHFPDISNCVSTDQTNWTFVGNESSPSWKNQNTGHHLILDASETDDYDYRLRLNHEEQATPWWTVTELESKTHAPPIVEWMLSTPEEELFHREAISHAQNAFRELVDEERFQSQPQDD